MSNHTQSHSLPHPGPAPHQPLNHTNNPATSHLTDYQRQEIDQYTWLMHQIDNFGEHLEGMEIGTSRAEDQFKKCASIAVVVLFLFMLAHQVMKFLRFKQTEWQPNMNLYKIPDGIKTLSNMIEKELAPTFMVITFLISVGSFYGFATICLACVVVTSAILFFGYFKVNNEVVKCSRILLVIFTLFLFISLLADDHVFNEQTLPQKIEEHMTAQAKARHAPRSQRPRTSSADGKNRNNSRNPNMTTAGRMRNFANNSTMPWDRINEQVHQNYSDWKHAKDLYDAAHSNASQHALNNDDSGN